MRIPLVKAASLILAGAALFFLSHCSKPETVAGEVLVRVGDRVITREDFMRRAEYTIRPDFCAGENYIHRKIVLNNLIAEKLLALETAQSPLLDNPAFTAYIQGREEQAMRQWLAKLKGRDQVVLDTSEFEAEYRQSMRSYQLSYLTLPDSAAAAGFLRALEDGYDYESIARAIMDSDSLPIREMNWFERGEDALHSAIFSKGHTKGDVLNPIELTSGEFLVAKIYGWKDIPPVGDQAMSQQVKDVRERVVQKHADALYRSYVAELMAGKQLDLNENVFKAYAQRAGEVYLRTPEEKEALLQRAVWDEEEHIYTEAFGGEEALPGDALLFTMDGEAWTIDRFEIALRRHPLVFRKRSMSRSEFPQQLKFAIADMMRDETLTQEARKLGLDQVANIRQNVALWQDAYVARQARNDYVQQVLDARGDSTASQMAILEDIMNPMLDSLQAVYDGQIEINTDLFESLKLSDIHMVVSARNLPFPLSVPAFPRLTTDKLINYGKRLEP